MKRIFVSWGQDGVDLAETLGFSPVTIFDPSKHVAADEFVAVGPRARELMEALRAGGVNPVELSFVDETGKIRDWLWDDQRVAGEIEKTKDQKFLPCGIDGMRWKVRWRLPEVVVVAGPYGSGKSLFCQVLAQDFVRMTGMPAALCCWEDQADEVRDGLVRYRDSTILDDKSNEFRDTFLDQFRLTVIEPSRQRLLSAHFEQIEYQAKRFGTKFFVMDPWNEFDHEKHSRQSETEYVTAVMREIRRLVDRLGVIAMLTTHVSSEYILPDGGIKPFRIGHAFGSVQFGNKADRGFCVVRSDKWADEGKTHMIVRQDKVKLEDRNNCGPGRMDVVSRMGMKSTMLFYFDSKSNTLHFDGKASDLDDVKKIWRG